MRYKKTLTKSLIAVAFSGAFIAPTVAQAFEIKLSSQLSRKVVLPDDAAGDEVQHVDIGWRGSRFRFTGSETANNGITYGFRFEIQARENSDGEINGETFGDPGVDQDNRYQDLCFSG